MPRATSRIRRKHYPVGVDLSADYSRARPFLRRDFGQRCAYCMMHESLLGGEEAMQVEHFLPQKEGGDNDYDNLFWSCPTCNRNKSASWPTPTESSNGFRLVNPCEEWDYGGHFSQGVDGKLSIKTRAGSYHIDVLRLNRGRLVDQRRQDLERRAALAEAEKFLADLRGKDPLMASNVEPLVEHLRQYCEIAIPSYGLRRAAVRMASTAVP